MSVRIAKRITIQFPPKPLRWRLAFAWSALTRRDHDISGVTLKVEYEPPPSGDVTNQQPVKEEF